MDAQDMIPYGIENVHHHTLTDIEYQKGMELHEQQLIPAGVEELSEYDKQDAMMHYRADE